MTVYLDMDGVIADFFGAIKARFNVDHWKSLNDREAAFASLKYTDWFNTLPKFAESNKIVSFVEDITHGDWGICSSPLRGDRDNSAYWKRRWLEDNLYVPPLIENMIFTSNKHKYAWNKLTRKPNILIDDRPDNIRRWIEAGGIGIVFQCDQDDVETLFSKLEIAIERARTFELKNAV
jgi:hypothetical protein